MSRAIRQARPHRVVRRAPAASFIGVATARLEADVLAKVTPTAALGDEVLVESASTVGLTEAELARVASPALHVTAMDVVPSTGLAQVALARVASPTLPVTTMDVAPSTGGKRRVGQ